MKFMSLICVKIKTEMFGFEAPPHVFAACTSGVQFTAFLESCAHLQWLFSALHSQF